MVKKNNTPSAPAEEIVTLELIAKKAGVSPSTVSRILNGTARVSDAKRQAVEETIARFNFRPNALARGLARGQTFTIGVLTQAIDSPFYGEALHGIEDALSATPYIPLFASGHWNLKDEVERMALLEGRRVDGIIVLTGRLSDEKLMEYAQRVPIVITGRDLKAPNLVSINVDDFSGAFAATQHLIEFGHTRIACISGPQDHRDSEERLRGYRQALETAGIAYDPGLVVEADFHVSGGMLALNKLVNSGQPFTAVFAANDQMAYGVQLALYRLKFRVPEDISLVGFDDLPSSNYTIPPLTTVRQPVYDMGKLAAQAMLELLNGKSLEVSLPPLELIVRETTRRLRR